MLSYVLLRVFLILLLVAANAFFAAAEFSLVSIRDTRIQQLIETRRIGARIVQKLHRNLDEVVNGVQLGVTIVSLTLGWVGEPIVAHLVEGMGFINKVPHAMVYAHGIAITLAFTLITCLHVILGELVPKTLALQRAEQVALAVAAPMDVFLTIARPFLYLMSRAAGTVLRVFGSRETKHGAIHSPDELKLIVTASRQFGQIPPMQEEMIHNAIELENITVREVMVARPDIFSLPGNLTLDDALGRMVDEQHSRVPVYDPQRGPEHIIGVLYAKDLMRWMRLRVTTSPIQPVSGRVGSMKISQIMRDVLVVPETKILTELLEEFKERKRLLAVVVDEFGSTAGLITAEDILEQIVGEIEDEFDVTPAEADVLENETAMVLDGSEGIRDLDSQYQVQVPREAGFETLAGFALSQLQRIPQVGDSFEYEHHRFTIAEMEGRRIAKVKIEKLQSEPAGKTGN
jgi:CBS domain containing-hemolysin-like protein